MSYSCLIFLFYFILNWLVGVVKKDLSVEDFFTLGAIPTARLGCGLGVFRAKKVISATQACSDSRWTSTDWVGSQGMLA